jgi:hypothetical protein
LQCIECKKNGKLESLNTNISYKPLIKIKKSCPNNYGSLGFGCTQRNLHKFKKNVGCYTHTSKKRPTLTSKKQISYKTNLADCVNKPLMCKPCKT